MLSAASFEDLEENDRGRLVMPCGTGKSVVSLWIAERFAGRWRASALSRAVYCVDEPDDARVGGNSATPTSRTATSGCALTPAPDISAEDAAAGGTGHACHDRPAADRFAVRGHQDSAAMTVVFCTYQSLSLIADAQAEGGLVWRRPGVRLGAV